MKRKPRPDPVTEYARAVELGGIVAGPYVRASCRRHLDDLERSSRGDLPYVFDLGMVERALGFFRDCLCLNGGEFEGKPFILGAWQAFIVGSLFGWVDAAGLRRFRVGYAEAGKGNGKSPLSAGIGLYTLIADNEARAEIYAAASSRDQAMVLFRDAVAMVDLSPEIRGVVRQIGGSNVWNLLYGDNFFRAISSDDKKSGPRPHCSLVDEVHEHPDDVVIEMLRAGFKGRRQPLLFMITNSGTDRNSVCYRYHDYAVRVAERTHEDDRFFSYVCALDEKDEPFEDQSCWIKTNPNLGISVREDYVAGQIHEAKGMPAKESIVRRLSFCQWTDAANPWIQGDVWRACEVEDERSAVEFLAGMEVYLAVDLSLTTDLSALVAVGVQAERGKDHPPDLFATSWFWTPADTIRTRAARDRVPYELWTRQGHLIAVPGSTLDYAPIAEQIMELVAALDVRAIAFDRYRIKYLQDEIDGGDGLPFIAHPQGFGKPEGSALWMPQSVTKLEEAVLARRLRIKRNPVMTWNASSAVTESDKNQNRVFTKRKSLSRIDGVVALAMAVGAATAGLEAAEVSERALFFV